MTVVLVDAARALTPAYERDLDRFFGDVASVAAKREAVRRQEVGGACSAGAVSEAAETEALAQAVAASLCLVLNKVDLVNPKPLLLPFAAAADASLQAALRAAAARVAADGAAAAAPAAAGKAGKEGKGDRRRSGGGEPYELPVPVFFISATSQGRAGGLSDLRAFLHSKAVPRAWKGDDDYDNHVEEGETGSSDDGGFFDLEDGGEGEGGGGSEPPAGGGAGVPLVDQLGLRGSGRLVATRRRGRDKGIAAATALGNSGGGGGGDSGESAGNGVSGGFAGYDCVSNAEQDDREWVAECIREKLFKYLHKELPYRVEQVRRDIAHTRTHARTPKQGQAPSGLSCALSYLLAWPSCLWRDLARLFSLGPDFHLLLFLLLSRPGQPPLGAPPEPERGATGTEGWRRRQRRRCPRRKRRRQARPQLRQPRAGRRTGRVRGGPGKHAGGAHGPCGGVPEPQAPDHRPGGRPAAANHQRRGGGHPQAPRRARPPAPLGPRGPRRAPPLSRFRSRTRTYTIPYGTEASAAG